MVDVGVALPANRPGTPWTTTLEWARRADEGPFSSIALADRLDYPNADPLVTLAAAAAATSRVGIVTSALLAPLRGAASVAKQIATLADIAGGRLTLGVAVGARPVDFQLAGVPWERRGRILDEQLELLASLRSPADPEQDLGPALDGELPILIGGASPPALRRMVKHGAGYISGGVNPRIFGFEVAAAREAWEASGRPEPMRVVAVTWFASDRSYERAKAAQAAYYAKGGLPPQVSDEMHRGADGVRRAVETFAELGADEVILATYAPDVEDVEWLAGVIGDLR